MKNNIVKTLPNGVVFNFHDKAVVGQTEGITLDILKTMTEFKLTLSIDPNLVVAAYLTKHIIDVLKEFIDKFPKEVKVDVKYKSDNVVLTEKYTNKIIDTTNANSANINEE